MGIMFFIATIGTVLGISFALDYYKKAKYAQRLLKESRQTIVDMNYKHSNRLWEERQKLINLLNSDVQTTIECNFWLDFDNKVIRHFRYARGIFTVQQFYDWHQEQMDDWLYLAKPIAIKALKKNPITLHINSGLGWSIEEECFQFLKDGYIDGRQV